jgi:hypothetical protein
MLDLPIREFDGSKAEYKATMPCSKPVEASKRRSRPASASRSKVPTASPTASAPTVADLIEEIEDDPVGLDLLDDDDAPTTDFVIPKSSRRRKIKASGWRGPSR